MKILNKHGLSGLLEKLMLFLFLILLIALPSMPWLVSALLNYYGRLTSFTMHTHFWIFLIFFDYCIGFAAAALWQCFKIIRHINAGQPFIEDNARRLCKIAVCSAAESVGFVIAVFFIQSLFMPVLAFVFAIFSVLMIVCSKLFHRAVEFKEENELTI